MSNTKHTPGKLFSQAAVVIVKIENSVYHVCDCNSPLGQHHRENGYEEAKANAERIVRCWNNHDELLEALQMVRSWYETTGTAILRRQPGSPTPICFSKALSAILNATE